MPGLFLIAVFLIVTLVNLYCCFTSLSGSRGFQVSCAPCLVFCSGQFLVELFKFPFVCSYVIKTSSIRYIVGDWLGGIIFGRVGELDLC